MTDWARHLMKCEQCRECAEVGDPMVLCDVGEYLLNVEVEKLKAEQADERA